MPPPTALQRELATQGRQLAAAQEEVAAANELVEVLASTPVAFTTGTGPAEVVELRVGLPAVGAGQWVWGCGCCPGAAGGARRPCLLGLHQSSEQLAAEKNSAQPLSGSPASDRQPTPLLPPAANALLPQRALESTRAELASARREAAAANELVNLLSAGAEGPLAGLVPAPAPAAAASSGEVEALRVRGLILGAAAFWLCFRTLAPSTSLNWAETC